MENIELLFKQLEIIDMKYKKLNEILLDDFNIFSILLKSSDEVNLHSRFIYELLNPDGSHNQGNLFIELFLKEIKIDFSLNNISIFREKLNIDILLQSPNQSIIIENKIYTQDHSNQLSKYLNIIKKQGYKEENIFIIYLTLFGEDANERTMLKNIINISYEEHIKHWIEGCIKEMALIPTIREILSQYLNLIKTLTNQSQYKGFILEIKDFLLKDNNFKMVLNIQNSIIEAKIQIQLDFWQSLLNNLNKDYDFNFYNNNQNGNKNMKNSIEKYYKQLKNRKDYGIEYKVDENLYFFIELRNNIYYGFYFPDEDIINKVQINKLNNIQINWDDISESIYWKYSDKKLDFESFNSNVLNLINSDLREKEIKMISDKISNLIIQYNKS